MPKWLATMLRDWHRTRVQSYRSLLRSNARDCTAVIAVAG
jgi:hypothetical protein